MNDNIYLVAVELKEHHIDILKRALGAEDNDGYWEDSENISDAIVELIEITGEMV